MSAASVSDPSDAGIFKPGETQDGLLDCVSSFYGAFSRAFPAKPSHDVFHARALPGLDCNGENYNAFCVLAIAGQFSQEEMDELNAVLETGVLGVNELVEMYGSMKIQILLELRKSNKEWS